MDVAATIQIWSNVITHPGEPVFVEEQSKPGATLGMALIWVIIAGIVSGILGWLNLKMLFGSGPMLDQLIQQANFPPEIAAQLREMIDSGMMGAMMGSAGLMSIVLAPILFLIGVGIFHLVARLLGGRGEFGRYAYLIAAFYAPISILNSFMGFIPILGSCLSLLLTIYNIVLAYFATKVAHDLSSGRALMVVLFPVVLFILLILCALGSMVGMLMSVGNG